MNIATAPQTPAVPAEADAPATPVAIEAPEAAEVFAAEGDLPAVLEASAVALPQTAVAEQDLSETAEFR